MASYSVVTLYCSHDSRNRVVDTIGYHPNNESVIDGAVELKYYEAKYGLLDELEKLAKGGVEYVAYDSGNGGDWGPTVTVSDGNKSVDFDTDVNGDPVISIRLVNDIRMTQVGDKSAWVSTKDLDDILLGTRMINDLFNLWKVQGNEGG